MNQVGREEAAEKPFLDERLVTREANEKMVLEPLAYSSDHRFPNLKNSVRYHFLIYHDVGLAICKQKGTK
ncbi:hypothetical protein CLV36_10996 [Laceyella sediminis]|jgi:hypothetical protein|uniref:Uncharacterized protein n=2 Tax=Laceyella sediminis TaxID=573074 RepID=A0ABX5EQT3_9BACL|nr:hypothetical protein CLV36_10996 [Laceyella sediminis]